MKKMKNTINEIREFFEQLFQNNSLRLTCGNIWLPYIIENQTFNIYNGSEKW